MSPVSFHFAFIVLFCVHGTIMLKYSIRNMPGHHHVNSESTSELLNLTGNPCSGNEKKFSTDGCNYCECDSNKSYRCGTKMCFLNARDLPVRKDYPCQYPGAYYIGRNYLLCRCSDNYKFHHCSSRNPSVKTRKVAHHYEI